MCTQHLLPYMFLDWTQSRQNHYWVRFISKLQVVARDSLRAKLARTAVSSPGLYPFLTSASVPLLFFHFTSFQELAAELSPILCSCVYLTSGLQGFLRKGRTVQRTFPPLPTAGKAKISPTHMTRKNMTPCRQAGHYQERERDTSGA